MVRGSEKMTFNAFQRAVEQGQIGDTITVKTKDLVVVGKLKSGKSFEVGFTQAFNIEEFLLANNVEFNTDIQESSIWVTLLSTFAPILLMIVFFIFLMNQMQGSGASDELRQVPGQTDDHGSAQDHFPRRGRGG